MRRARLTVGGSKALVTAAVRRVFVLLLPLRAVDCCTRTGTGDFFQDCSLQHTSLSMPRPIS